jgi:hypothetical protein
MTNDRNQRTVPHIIGNRSTLLSQENSILINRELKGVLVASTFQEGSIAGLLAIDTDEYSDLVKMQEYRLHSDVLDWIIAKSEVVRLLWRMKNNV